jgi:hypothetical protein
MPPIQRKLPKPEVSSYIEVYSTTRFFRLTYGSQIEYVQSNRSPIADEYRRSAIDYPVSRKGGGDDFNTGIVGEQAILVKLESLLFSLMGKCDGGILNKLAASRSILHIAKAHSLVRGVGDELLFDILEYARANNIDIITSITASEAGGKALERAGFIQNGVIESGQYRNYQWVLVLAEQKPMEEIRFYYADRGSQVASEYFPFVISMSGSQALSSAFTRIQERLASGGLFIDIRTPILARMRSFLPSELDGHKVAVYRLTDLDLVGNLPKESLIPIRIPGYEPTCFYIPD